MIYTDLNKKLIKIWNKIQSKYKSNQKLFIFSAVGFCIVFICFFSFLYVSLETGNFNFSSKENPKITELRKSNEKNLERIKTLEQELSTKKSDETVAPTSTTTLESYKKELDDLITSINKKLDENNIDEYERYKLYITVNENEKKSKISITDTQNNNTLGEKDVDGMIEGKYGYIFAVSYFYQKIFFSIDPVIKDCENTNSNSEIEKCLEEIKNINKTYNDVGGLWYFDLKTNEFVQVLKLSQIYNGSVDK